MSQGTSILAITRKVATSWLVICYKMYFILWFLRGHSWALSFKNLPGSWQRFN